MMKTIGIIFCSALALLMINLDATAVNIVIPELMKEFSVSSDRMSVVVLAYLLGMVGTTLLFGKLADRIGHGKIFTGGYLLFLVGSILCALSWNMLSLTSFRFIQGLGGAMIAASSAAIIIKFLPERIRGRAFGVNGMMAGIGFALGSPVGGTVAAAYGWRSIFLINIPVSMVGIVLCFLFLRKEVVETVSHRLDKLGALVSFLFLSSIVLLLEVYTSVTSTIGLLAFIVFLFILFVRGGRVHPDPILDFKLFKSRSFTSSILALCCYYVILMGNGYIFPLFLAGGKGLNSIESGQLLFISPILGLILSPLAGLLSDRFGPRTIAGIGAMLFIFSSILFYHLPAVGNVAMYISFAVYGMALSLFMIPILCIVMDHAEFHNAGAISAVKAVIPNLFGLFAVGGYAITYSNGYWGNAGRLTEEQASGAAFSTTMLLSLIAAIVCASLLLWSRDRRVK